MQLLHAGLDWTATPSLNEPFPYGPGLVAVEDEEKLEAAFTAIRTQFGFEGEIKGHNSSGEVLNAVFEALIECEARVGVLLLDKSALLAQSQATLPAPALLRHQMGCALATQFIEKHALARLLCDEDIRGRGEWAAFRTEILRCNRRLRPDVKLKVAAWPSHHNVLIQAADCAAYVFSRAVRGGALDTRLRDNLRALQTREENIFMTVREWSETWGIS
jgi:hypothetical protein